MTDVEFSRLMSELTDTAKALNQESDSINDLIARFEEKLRTANLGIELWLTDALESDPWAEKDETGEIIARGTQDVQLGFARFRGNKWHLVTRNASYRRDGDSWEPTDRIDTRRTLLEESRDVRIAALAKFPSLARELKQAGAAAVQTIREAKKYVK